jgi:hypothetical protein
MPWGTEKPSNRDQVRILEKAHVHRTMFNENVSGEV